MMKKTTNTLSLFMPAWQNDVKEILKDFHDIFLTFPNGMSLRNL